MAFNLLFSSYCRLPPSPNARWWIYSRCEQSSAEWSGLWSSDWSQLFLWLASNWCQQGHLQPWWHIHLSWSEASMQGPQVRPALSYIVVSLITLTLAIIIIMVFSWLAIMDFFLPYIQVDIKKGNSTRLIGTLNYLHTQYTLSLLYLLYSLHNSCKKAYIAMCCLLSLTPLINSFDDWMGTVTIETVIVQLVQE